MKKTQAKIKTRIKDLKDRLKDLESDEDAKRKYYSDYQKGRVWQEIEMLKGEIRYLEYIIE